MQGPPYIGHTALSLLKSLSFNLYTFESSEIRTPPYTGQLTAIPVVSLLQRFHCTGQLTAVLVVSLL